jgi:hypothetical protein
MSPVLTTPLRQLQRHLIVAESIPSPRCEDIMVWAALNPSSGDRNSAQTAIVAAWRRLCGWLSDRLTLSVEPITHEALRRIAHARSRMVAERWRYRWCTFAGCHRSGRAGS